MTMSPSFAAANSFLAKAISDIRDDIERGSSLSAAMSKHPKVFSNLFVSMIKAGETGGQLDTVLMRVADNFEADHKLRAKVKSAMTYPIVVAGIAVLLVTVMLLFVVPTFAAMLVGLGGELPLPTKILLALSKSAKFAVPATFVLAIVGTGGYKRGRANADLTRELALSVARAAAGVLADRDGTSRPVAVVGRDPRASGEMLEAAVVAGLASAGAAVSCDT